MRNSLVALHDTDNGGLGLEASVLCNLLVGLLILFFGFLELNLVDFDAHLLVTEARVVGEHVGVFNLFTLGLLDKYLILGACERLKGSAQLGIG